MTDIVDRLNASLSVGYSELRKEAAATITRLRAKIKQMERQEPVAKVRIHQTGGNAGIAWSAQPLNDFDSLPPLRDGDKLYALPGARRMTMWQPIETAPKDGTIVLLAGEFDYPGDWRIKMGFWAADDDDWRLCWASWPPTHWMPLPEAPGAQAQPAPSFADAYQGAMEEVAIWKKRALEAEELNRKFVAEINGPVYMGEPVQPAPSMPVLTTAARDVLAERLRQTGAEGWTPEHDDEHKQFELTRAASCYALDTAGYSNYQKRLWPWDGKYWKPSVPRRNLVKAGALILAELERLDRAAAPEAK